MTIDHFHTKEFPLFTHARKCIHNCKLIQYYLFGIHIGLGIDHILLSNKYCTLHGTKHYIGCTHKSNTTG
jgi:hypothetical protein